MLRFTIKFSKANIKKCQTMLTIDSKIKVVRLFNFSVSVVLRIWVSDNTDRDLISKITADSILSPAERIWHKGGTTCSSLRLMAIFSTVNVFKASFFLNPNFTLQLHFFSRQYQSRSWSFSLSSVLLLSSHLFLTSQIFFPGGNRNASEKCEDGGAQAAEHEQHHFRTPYIRRLLTAFHSGNSCIQLY